MALKRRVLGVAYVAGLWHEFPPGQASSHRGDADRMCQGLPLEPLESTDARKTGAARKRGAHTPAHLNGPRYFRARSARLRLPQGQSASKKNENGPTTLPQTSAVAVSLAVLESRAFSPGRVRPTNLTEARRRATTSQLAVRCETLFRAPRFVFRRRIDDDVSGARPRGPTYLSTF